MILILSPLANYIRFLLVFHCSYIMLLSCACHISERVELGMSNLARRLAIANAIEHSSIRTMEYVPQLEMWANAQRDGRPAKYGGALCSTP